MGSHKYLKPGHRAALRARLRLEADDIDDLEPEQAFRVERARVKSRQRIAADVKRLEFFVAERKTELTGSRDVEGSE